MTPGAYPLVLYRGDSYKWRVVIWLNTQRTQPFDLSGMATKAEIRAKPGAVKATLIGTTVTLPNIIDLYLSAQACRNLPDECVWDLQLTYDNGDVATVLAGTVTVTPDVTDSAAARTLQRVA